MLRNKSINENNFAMRLHDIIPGGAHTYSRGDDQFPSNAPEILVKGEGAYVWDANGNKFLDYGMGLRSVNIGYGNKEIAMAAYEEILKGNNLTRASVTELEAAELLSETIHSAEMVKFAKHGSVVTTAAVKLARAYTGRKYVAVPHEHPFFSFDDWFIGSTVLQKGVLEETKNFTLKFHYNNIQSLSALFDQYPGQIAAVIMEPATTVGPCLHSCDDKCICTDCPDNQKNFLHQVRQLTSVNGTVFILDEMITGFRWHLNGAQHFYGVEPDLSTFGKAMANGFAVAALTGKREIMKLGSILDEGKERVFLTSTTHGAEMGALGAFIKTIEILKRDHVVEHFWSYGRRLKDGLNSIAAELGISDCFIAEGYPCSLNYITRDKSGAVSLPFRTLFAQEMINNKVMIPYIALCFAHGDEELNMTLEAARNSLKIYRDALNGEIETFLKGRTIKPVFRKYN
jgi:glutamate-1-semialdehyde 2,1-aminomutase